MALRIFHDAPFMDGGGKPYRDGVVLPAFGGLLDLGNELAGGDGDDWVRSGGPDRVAQDAPRSTTVVRATTPAPGAAGSYFRKHPGFGESLIPFWGSAREAIADGYDGNIGGAIFNGALAVSDLAPGAFAIKGLGEAGVKAALKDGTSTTWNAVRKRMGRAGYFAEGEQGHHWAIPQRWAWVPETIRNHPMNIMPLPVDVHKRIHFNDLVESLPRFTVREQLLHGTPTWAKAVTGQTVANSVGKGVNTAVNNRGW